MYNVVIIDDHKLLRDMIAETLNSEGIFNIVATDGNAKNSVALCEKFKPDLILMDICTEDNSNGLVYSKIIKEQFPDTKIIIMTGLLDLNFINEAKEFKVDSFIYKNISKDSLIMTIKNTLDGYSIYPTEKVKTNVPNILVNLTNTELKILTSYCKLLDRDEVAKELGISIRTLKTHISSIYEKTGYKSLTKLSIYCVVNGLIVPSLETQD